MASIVPAGEMSDSATPRTRGRSSGLPSGGRELPPDLEPLDVRHLGRERVICCWRVGDVPRRSRPGVLRGDAARGCSGVVARARSCSPTSTSTTPARPATLVRRWPDLAVYVHERGAPHVVDPSRLLRERRAPLRRGHGAPVGRDRCRCPRSASTCSPAARRSTSPAGSRSRYTPGHASHHVAYLPRGDRRAFVGDMAGVRIPPAASRSRRPRRRTSTSRRGSASLDRDRRLGARRASRSPTSARSTTSPRRSTAHAREPRRPRRAGARPRRTTRSRRASGRDSRRPRHERTAAVFEQRLLRPLPVRRPRRATGPSARARRRPPRGSIAAMPQTVERARVAGPGYGASAATGA